MVLMIHNGIESGGRFIADRPALLHPSVPHSTAPWRPWALRLAPTKSRSSAAPRVAVAADGDCLKMGISGLLQRRRLVAELHLHAHGDDVYAGVGRADEADTTLSPVDRAVVDEDLR